MSVLYRHFLSQGHAFQLLTFFFFFIFFTFSVLGENFSRRHFTIFFAENKFRNFMQILHKNVKAYFLEKAYFFRKISSVCHLMKVMFKNMYGYHIFNQE